MKQVIMDFPKQFKVGMERAQHIKLSGPFDKVIICGVGGSALQGSLLLDMDFLKTPLFIQREYGLPKQADEKSLIICISFSGNTEETLSAYGEAIEKRLKVVAIATGGKIEELAKVNGQPIVIVPNDCLQPRMGTGYLVGAVLTILANADLIDDKSKELLALSENLKPEQFEKSGKALAERLVDKVPIVYSSARFKAIARICKIKFNENSKIMAFWNYFPELNHNEMVGLTNLKANFHFLILRDANDNPRNLKRMDLFVALAKEKGAEAETIDIVGENVLEKIFKTLLLFDWASYYLALAYGQDPLPVKIVEEFKKRLAQ